MVRIFLVRISHKQGLTKEESLKILPSIISELKRIADSTRLTFNFSKVNCFDEGEENTRVWYYDIQKDLGFVTFQRIANAVIKQCLVKGIIGNDWKKTEKYHFEEDNFDHIGVGKFGNMFGVQAHLTFLRVLVKFETPVTYSLD